MPFSVYSSPRNGAKRVFYGVVESTQEMVRTLKRLKRAGVVEPYSIGFDPEMAELTKRLAPEAANCAGTIAAISPAEPAQIDPQY